MYNGYGLLIGVNLRFADKYEAIIFLALKLGAYNTTS